MKQSEKPRRSGLLTVSRFAKLRNVNVNSMRYYEKLGILCPTYIDEQTGYRYYALEQLHMLDIILLCIELNIPLKNLSRFTFRDSVQLRELLYEGRRIAEERYNDMVIGLKKLERLVAFLDQANAPLPNRIVYQRKIAKRLLYTQEYYGDLRDIERVQRALAKMVTDCPPARYLTFMSGFLLKFADDGVRQYLFYEMIDDGKTAENERIVHLGEAEFRCYQLSMERSSCDYYTLIRDNFGAIREGTVIISNLVKDSMQLETSYREVQVLAASQAE